MAWVRLDDGLSDHPKILAAGPEAAWLYVCGLLYANRQLTDGFIPAAQIARLTTTRRHREATDRLVSVGLWELCEGGFQIHDWADYNAPAERIREQRRAAAERQSRWRDGHRTPEGAFSERPPSRNGHSATNGVTNALRDQAQMHEVAISNARSRDLKCTKGPSSAAENVAPETQETAGENQPSSTVSGVNGAESSDPSPVSNALRDASVTPLVARDVTPPHPTPRRSHIETDPVDASLGTPSDSQHAAPRRDFSPVDPSLIALYRECTEAEPDAEEQRILRQYARLDPPPDEAEMREAFGKTWDRQPHGSYARYALAIIQATRRGIGS